MAYGWSIAQTARTVKRDLPSDRFRPYSAYVPSPSLSLYQESPHALHVQPDDSCRLLRGVQPQGNRVNFEYQRNPGVWPAPARSFLIETILMGFPMPKMYMRQLTDVRSKRTSKEIVDGQQRTIAIVDFFEGKFAISRRGSLPEAAGKTYNDLAPDQQAAFINYALPIDLLLNADDYDVVEVFRRLNSYTVALNNEEKRHAEWQGDFKWLIYGLTRKWSKAMVQMGVFTEKQINRMQDAKLLTEVAHAMEHGITTTTKHSLDKIYELHDSKFSNLDLYEERINAGLTDMLDLKPFHGGPLMKSYHVYSLLLALIHTRSHLRSLKAAYPPSQKRKHVTPEALAGLSRLAAALEVPENAGRLRRFVEASDDQTNVAANRLIRFVEFCRALDQ